MNKLSLLFVAFIPVLITSCNTEQTQVCPSAEEAAALHGQLEKAAVTNTEIMMIPGKGIGDVQFGMTKAKVKKLLGTPYRISDSAYEYQMLGFAIGFDHTGRVVTFLAGGWCESSDILVDVFKGITPDGIKMRSSKEQVIQVYGEPSRVRDSTNESAFADILIYDELGTIFSFRNDELIHISMLKLKN